MTLRLDPPEVRVKGCNSPARGLNGGNRVLEVGCGAADSCAADAGEARGDGDRGKEQGRDRVDL